jgi:hypothetical protein
MLNNALGNMGGPYFPCSSVICSCSEELEERGNGKGKLAEASEEGQGPRRAVEPMMI